MYRFCSTALALIAAALAGFIAPTVRAADPPDTYIRAGHLLDVRTG